MDETQRDRLPVGVLRLAIRYAAHCDVLRPRFAQGFAHRQPLALWVLRKYMKTTSRGVIDQFILMPQPREAIGRKRVPNDTRLYLEV